MKLSSELLVTGDDGLHLLTAPQLIVWAFHLPQTGGERNIGTDHHVHAAERRRTGLVSSLPDAFILKNISINLWESEPLTVAVSADSHVKPTNVQQVADPSGPHEAKRQHESSWLQNTNNPLKGRGHKQETSEAIKDSHLIQGMVPK